MLFLALAAGGAAVLEVHRAIAGKASSDPEVVGMRQREQELKEALGVNLNAQISLFSAALWIASPLMPSGLGAPSTAAAAPHLDVLDTLTVD